jgi:3-dehydroquinate synthase
MPMAPELKKLRQEIDYCFDEFKNSFPSSITILPIVIDAGEKSKSFSTAEKIWNFLFENNATKQDCLIVLGGGVLSDIGGLVAALYKRGLGFYIFPTTLMAMTDAALGGKTGIDYHDYKNSIGTYYLPQKIFIATTFLNSLSEREIKNGLVEVYKHAIIFDTELWEDLQNNVDLENILKKSIAVKATIVNNDFLEKGQRKILNFGHTIGHAIEGYSIKAGFDLLHGEAVVIGMKIESEIAFSIGILSEENKNEIVQVLNEKFPFVLNYKFEFEELTHFLLQDKKNTSTINFSLPIKIGSCEFNQTASLEGIKKAISLFVELA